MDAVDHAHYKEEQRAYYQGFVDSVQVLDGLGIIKKRMRIKEFLKKFRSWGYSILWDVCMSEDRLPQ